MVKTDDIPELKKAVMTIQRMSADEELRYIQEMREKALHDEASLLSSAREEGFEEGFEIGWKEGLEITKIVSSDKMAEALKNKGFSEEKIEELMSLFLGE